MNETTILIVAAVTGLIILLILAVRYLRQVLLVLVGLAVVGGGGYLLLVQGQASREAAKAAKTAATAAAVSSAGQTATSLALAALAGALAILIVVGLVIAAYAWIRARRAQAESDHDVAPAYAGGDLWLPVLVGQALGQITALQQTVAGLVSPARRSPRPFYAAPQPTVAVPWTWNAGSGTGGWETWDQEDGWRLDAGEEEDLWTAH